MYGEHAHMYTIVEREGLGLKLGPVGGWCGVTSRELYTRVGGIGRKKLTYWHWDGQYLGRLDKAGYGGAILNDLAVTHAGGEYYSPAFREKVEFWEARKKRAARRARIKRVLLRLPAVARLNAHYQWFVPPS